ncbi:MAG: aminotransferase class I/II-fold pyridoxal phosphate-dependent enzyme [Betaproteobacteria bacterium]|nr:aminotransferase class I/II-fold pyridoxal phosphate-dependent enzyme [Betaproteobacteria bacterium]
MQSLAYSVIYREVRFMRFRTEEFADVMLEKANVALLPGSNFGSQGEGFVRMVYATSEERIQTALERITEACKRL